LALPRFEECDAVAVVKFGNFIEVVKVVFGVEFGVFARVREHAY
jgi:hypothetical protein